MSYISRSRELFLESLTAIGLNARKYGLHSLRAGGATQATRHVDVCEELVQKHGRWVTRRSKNMYVKDKMERRLRITLNLGL